MLRAPHERNLEQAASYWVVHDRDDEMNEFDFVQSYDNMHSHVKPVHNTSDVLIDPPLCKDYGAASIALPTSMNNREKIATYSSLYKVLKDELDVPSDPNDQDKRKYIQEFLEHIQEDMLQIEEFIKDNSIEQTLMKERLDIESVEEIDLKEEIETVYRKLVRDNAPISDLSNKAPSEHVLHNMSCNTVQVVKHRGVYTVVIDGISQGRIEDASKRQSYYMPRFKEGYYLDEYGNFQRNVNPVLFQLKVENYDLPPKKCYIEVVQQTISNGMVIVPPTVVKTFPLEHHHESSSMYAPTVPLPYPLASTSLPYIIVNDYSELKEAEIYLIFSKYKWDIFETLKWWLTNSVESFKNYLIFHVLYDTTTTAYEAFKAPLTFLKASLWWGLNSTYTVLKATIFTALDVKIEEANYIERIYEIVTDIISGQSSLQTYLAVLFLARAAAEGIHTLRHIWKTRHLKGVPEQDYKVALSAYERTCYQLPKQHVIYTHEIPSILDLISDTRSNGSLVDGSERTTGYTYHDFKDKGWHKEAAFMNWLINGEGPRYDNTKTKPNVVTGIYSKKQNLEQYAKILKQTYPSDFLLTGNTINKSGMDPSTLCNTRTEITYRICIEEYNNTYGPTIEMCSTRMNAIDAFWVSSSISRDIKNILRSTYRLEYHLMSLPSVGRWINSMSPFVADSSNGRVYGSVSNKNLNDSTGRRPFLERGGPSNDEESKALNEYHFTKQEEMEEQKRTKVVERLQHWKDQEVKTREDIDRKREEYQQQIHETEADQNMAPHRRRQKIEKLTERFKKTKERLTKSLEKTMKIVYKYETDMSQIKTNIRHVHRNKQSASENVERTSNIINYVDVVQRIRDTILGTSSRGTDPNGTTTTHNYEDVDELQKLSDIFDRKDYGILSKTLIFLRKSIKLYVSKIKKLLNYIKGNKILEDILKETSSFEQHIESVIKYVSQCLSIPIKNSNHVMVLRCLRIFSIVVPSDQLEPTMRLLSFHVPYDDTWNDEDALQPMSSLIRVTPQITSYSTSKMSQFGKVTSYSLKMLDSWSANEWKNAHSSIVNGKIALESIFSHMNVEKRRLWNRTSHFAQVFEPIADDDTREYIESFRTVPSPYSFLSYSSFSSVAPICVQISDDMFSVASSKMYSSLQRIASGHVRGGVSKTLSELGVNTSSFSVTALEIMCNIVTLHLMNSILSDVEQNTAVPLEVLYNVRAADLFTKSLDSVKTVCVFLKEMYTKDTTLSLVMKIDDPSLCAIPGMDCVSIAMDHMTSLMGSYKGYFRWGSINERVALGVLHDLEIMSRAKKLLPHKLPFPCIQTIGAHIPQQLSYASQELSMLEMSVHTCFESYRRMLVACSGIYSSAKDVISPAFLSTIVDTICTYPIVLLLERVDQRTLNRILDMKYAKDEYHSQKDWEPPSPYVTVLQLLVKMSKTRVNIPLTGLETDTVGTLIKDMNEMTFRDVSATISVAAATYHIPYGSVLQGNPMDERFCSFDMHPVWLDHWLEDIDRFDAHLSSTVSVEHCDLLYMIYDDINHVQRPFCPQHVVVRPDEVSIFATKVKRLEVDETVRMWSVESIELVKTLTSACNAINNDSVIRRLSSMTKRMFRSISHNTERLIQALFVHTASKTMSSNTSTTKRHLVMRFTEDSKDHAQNVSLALSASLANCMTRDILHKAHSIVPLMSVHSAIHKNVLRDLRSAIQTMRLHGIKSCPFSEACRILCVVVNAHTHTF